MIEVEVEVGTVFIMQTRFCLSALPESYYTQLCLLVVAGVVEKISETGVFSRVVDSSGS